MSRIGFFIAASMLSDVSVAEIEMSSLSALGRSKVAINSLSWISILWSGLSRFLFRS